MPMTRTEPSHIQLGPFRLLHRIGRGGMGDVWAARHESDGALVALKLLTGAALAKPAFHELFRNEIRAFAGLDHPNIVTIHDYGRTPSTFGPLDDVAPDVPWFAMELVDGGSLRELRGKLEWREVKQALLSVLDALAHAHARGVIHRDIKPANVLLVPGRSAYKLTDFGLAHMAERDAESSPEFATGTPAYMAPEQVLARVRDQGPWTDLYAVGCLTYSLLAGSAPFSELGPQQAAIAQLQRPLPALPDRTDIPFGLEDWMSRLTEKEPRRRYLRAADAAWALLELDAVPSDYRVEVDEDPTLDLSADRENTGVTLDVLVQHVGQSLGTRVSETTDTVRPPIPTSWRRKEEPLRATKHLSGTGLELFRLRTVPMVDRTAERDALWKLLHDVVDTESVRVVLLRGPAGIGKSRLAHWLIERSHELGSASALVGSHRATPEALDGLRGMMTRTTRTEGLVEADVAERCRAYLRDMGVFDPDEWLALAELVAPDGRPDDRGRRIRFGSPRERYALLTRILVRMAQARPLVLVLEDGQWAEDSLAFVDFLVEEAPEAGPILVVVTVGDEELESRPAESRRLSELAARDDITTTLPVERLDAQSHERLVGELLGLEPQTARGVAEHTAGNPLFAVQLVGAWIDRGILELGPDGFRLLRDADPAMPDQVFAVWTERMQRGLESLPLDAQITVEAAAALGLDIDVQEWRAVCRELEATPSFEAVEQLAARGLLTPSPRGLRDGWSFTHVMLREALLNRAKKEGRLRDLHRGCARALERVAGPLARERAGRHHLRAHAWESALAPLLDATRERTKRGEHEAALLLLDGRERALESLPDSAAIDPVSIEGWRIEGWLERARIELALGRHEDARRWIVRIEQEATAETARVLAEAWLLEGSRLRWLGLLDAAWRSLRRAETAFEELADLAVLPRVWEGMAEVLTAQGRLPAAEALYRKAITASERAKDRIALSPAYRGLGNVLVRLERYVEAEAMFEQAAEVAESEGWREEMARIALGRGEVARFTGHRVGAARFYRLAVDTHEQIGAFSWKTVPLLNLAMLAIEDDHLDEARTVVEEILALLGAYGQARFAAPAHMMMGIVEIGSGSRDRFRQHWERARRFIAERPDYQPDTATLAEMIAQRAARQGEPEIARAAYTVAVEFWTRLGRAEAIDRVRSHIQDPPRRG